MKEVQFRPLRRIRKSGKITVASYSQWNRLRTANYNQFNLIIDNKYKEMPSSEYVYRHDGEQLFWFIYNPANIPVFEYSRLLDWDEMRLNKEYILRWVPGTNMSNSYYGRGIDCSGTPAFSHYTIDYIATHFKDMNDFEPLTVGMVRHWFGWFLYNLENSVTRYKQ